MPRKPPSIQRRTRISPELDAMLHEEAMIQDRSMNSIIVDALLDYISSMQRIRRFYKETNDNEQS